MTVIVSSMHAYLVILCMFYTCVAHSAGEAITIAALIPADEKRLFSIARVEPALAIAVEKISAEHPLLYNRYLAVKYADSNCSIADGINEAINFYVKGEVNVYFGPCCDYAAAPVARQLKYWNIPMMTPGALACDFAKKEMFSLTTRLGPTFNSLVYFFVHLLQFHDWSRLKIIYDPKGHDEIIDQYCHIFTDGLHSGLRIQRTISNLSQEYFKFDLLSDMTENFEEHIGNKFANKTVCIDISSIVGWKSRKHSTALMCLDGMGIDKPITWLQMNEELIVVHHIIAKMTSNVPNMIVY